MNGLFSPAAYMNGDVFVIAAQKAGIGTDIDTLNMIVNLVNQGVNPEQAAEIIAKSMNVNFYNKQTPQKTKIKGLLG